MRPLLIMCALALIAGGCADPLEQRSTQEVGGQLERGVTGQGTVGPLTAPQTIPPASTASPKLIRNWREDRGPAETFENSHSRFRFAIHPGHWPAHSRAAGLFGDCPLRYFG